MYKNIIILVMMTAVMSALYSYAVYWKLKANYDALTCVYNKRKYFSFINKFFKWKHINSARGIIIFDIDNFKIYNDTYGHNKGDYILINFAKSLKEIFRLKKFKVFRIGGDEFAVFFKDTDKNTIISHLDMLTVKVWKEYNVKFSYGFAFFSQKLCNTEMLFIEADKMMFERKREKTFIDKSQ